MRPHGDSCVTGHGDVLVIELLGGFRIRTGSGVIDESAWRQRNAARLVKLLALASGHSLHRDEIMDALWPDRESDDASNSLHYTLHVARRILRPITAQPDEILIFRGQRIELAPLGMAQTDVASFEEAVKTALSSTDPQHYEQAIDLYTGDLLPDDRYEEWAAARREGLRDTFLLLLTAIAHIREATGDLVAAIVSLERVLAIDPSREEAHAGLMRLYAQQGKRHQALRQYSRLREALRRELDVEPDSASQHLYQDILTGRYPAGQHNTGYAAEPALSADDLGERRHNLPDSFTSFIGRRREITEVDALLQSSRLVTLTGTGGAGKTRLALEAVRPLVERFPDGVWLVDLSALADPDLVAKRVAVTLEIAEEREKPLTETLTLVLAPRRLLLVLDNCEHLIDACAVLVETLLRSCPDVRILATSRERLRVPGERTWRVPPLQLPEIAETLVPEHVGSVEAVKLFTERAAFARPEFTITAGTADAIVSICRKLDGIPLAIELAAARIAILTPEQLASRLDDALPVLTRSDRGIVPRQQTLQATLDWSYQLLSAPEKLALSRLAVFSGGWTVDAAEAVINGDDVSESRVLDLLSQLAEKSLVVVQAYQDEARYRLLETVRQYAWRRLNERGEADIIQERHASYIVEFAERAHAGFETPVRTVWQEWVEREIDNLRAVLRWTLGAGRIELGLRLGAAFGDFWFVHSRQREGRVWLSALLDHSDSHAVKLRPIRGEVLAVAFTLAYRQGDLLESRRLAEECLSLQRAVGDLPRVAWALSSLAMPVGELGDLDGSERLLEESLALSREMDDTFGTARALDTLGELNRFRGDFRRAHELYTESLELFRQLGAVPHVASVLHNIGQAAQVLGDPHASIRFQRESLLLHQQLRHPHGVVFALGGLAGACAAIGLTEQAVRLFAAAENLYALHGVVSDAADRRQEGHTLRRARDELGAAAYDAAWQAGSRLGLEEAVSEALSIDPTSVTRARPRQIEPLPSLSQRELEVARLVAHGLTNQQIATELGMAPRTVDTHVSRILRKLGVASRSEVAATLAAKRDHLDD